MKKRNTVVFLSALASVFLLSCALGSDPAWQANTALVLDFDGSLPNDPAFVSGVGERAFVRGGGILYIQVGTGSRKPLLGPYRASSANRFVINDLQAGDYADLFFIYTPEVISFTKSPVTDAGSASEDLRTSIVALYSGNPDLGNSIARSVSMARVSAVQIKQGQENTIKTSFIPITDLSFAVASIDPLDYAIEDFSGYGNLTVTGIGGRHERVFVKLTNVGDDLTTGQLIDFMHCLITNNSATNASIGSVALYKADGRRVFSSLVDDVLLPGDDAEAGVPFFNGSDYYIYVEFLGESINIRFGAVRATP